MNCLHPIVKNVDPVNRPNATEGRTAQLTYVLRAILWKYTVVNNTILKQIITVAEADVST